VFMLLFLTVWRKHNIPADDAKQDVIERLIDHRDPSIVQQRERILATSFSMPAATSLIPGPSI
jgi:hypothetical protein